MSQHVTSFPWKIKKFSRLACHSYSFNDPYLGMACHCMSRVVTACHGNSRDKGGVTKGQT